MDVEEIVEKEGNAKGEGFMSSLAFITVKATVRGEAKSYEWVVKSTPREANRYPDNFNFNAHQGKLAHKFSPGLFWLILTCTSGQTCR